MAESEPSPGLNRREFRATWVRIIDGDTVRATIDIGFGISLTEYLRIEGINCPEMDTEEGKRAKRRVEELLGDPIMLSPPYHTVTCSGRRDKYGRILADFVIPAVTPDDQSELLSDILVREGYARQVMYCPDDYSDTPTEGWL